MTHSERTAAERSSRDAKPRKPLYEKLRPGPSHAPQDVRANQRARICGAMVELSAERGYERVTVRALARTAGVSSRTFYRHFSNGEECFAATYEVLMERIERQANAERREGAGWEENMRAGLAAVLRELASRPRSANLVLVEAFAAGPAMRERMAASSTRFEHVLLDGLAPPGESPRPAAAHLAAAVVAGVARVARARLLAGRAKELPGLAGELGDWITALRRSCDAPAPPRDVRRLPRGRQSCRAGREIPRLGQLGDEHGRLLTAAARLGASRGFPSLTVSTIRTHAGASRRGFEARFTGADDCFLEAIEALMRTIVRRAASQASTAADLEQAVQLAAVAICAELARNPALAWLGFVEILAPGRDGLHRRERLIAQAAHGLQDLAPASQRPSEPAAEAAVAAAWHLVASEVTAGKTESLTRLAPFLARILIPSGDPTDQAPKPEFQR